MGKENGGHCIGPPFFIVQKAICKKDFILAFPINSGNQPPQLIIFSATPTPGANRRAGHIGINLKGGCSNPILAENLRAIDAIAEARAIASKCVLAVIQL